jgi:hypothetical protein
MLHVSFKPPNIPDPEAAYFCPDEVEVPGPDEVLE